MSKKQTPFKYLNDLANRIKTIRRDNNLTQTKMGEAVGVSEGAVRGWEDARYEPPLSYLAYLSEQFGCDLNWLILGKEAPHAAPPEGLVSSVPVIDEEKVELLRENRQLRKELDEVKKVTGAEFRISTAPAAPGKASGLD